MKITALQEYGLRILLQLAEGCVNGEPMRIRVIAGNEALSIDYVEKILTRLRKSGLVKSVRGLNGGYTLSRGPGKISLGEAVMALTEKPLKMDRLKKDLCGQFPGNRTSCIHLKGCTIRQVWSIVVFQLYGHLNQIYLTDLLGSESVVQSRLSGILERKPVLAGGMESGSKNSRKEVTV